MIRGKYVVTLWMGLVGMAVVGCAPKMTVEKMKEMKPQRPAELDKLNMLAGKWEASGEAKMMGLDKPLTAKGTSQMAWDCDNWYLVEHSDYEMSELGKMKAIGIWTYDPKAKKYRIWWFDSMGATGRGTATFDEETKTWQMKAKGQSPYGKTAGRGTTKMLDNNTIEWSWEEWPAWDLFGMMKVFDMKGTSKRK